MTQQTLLTFLNKKRQTSLSTIYTQFNCTTPKSKKRVKTLLTALDEQKLLSYNTKTSRVTVQGGDTQKKRRKQPAAQYSYSNSRVFRYTENPMDDLKIIKEKYDIPRDFLPLITKEVEDKVWEKTADDPREDLRESFIITIDGADSKDLDDAVSISKSLFGTWELGVHIADVSHYVPQNTALDIEAKHRANSYYFINKVTPMLPKELSNELCSLNPNEEKKTMSIFIKFDRDGNVKSYRITPSVIKSSYRMTYDRVEEIIKGASEKDQKLRKNILMMNQLFRILNKKRLQSGGVDFNFREKKIILDDDGNPVKVYQKDRQDSERLIEEFMLAANQAAGEFLTKNGMGLYRVHDIPPSEKYSKLQNFAAKIGYKLSTVPDSKDLQKFIASLDGLPMQMSGEILALRSMAQAVYQQDNIGHFGLGFELYSHFTSPIRRYADLVVHRLIKYYLFKKGKPPYTSDELDSIAGHISSQERIAMEAERDLFKIKSVRFMKSKEGQTLKGKISSVANFGVFLEDADTGIEAMMRYTDMPNYMIFDENSLTAYNRNRTIVYSIGMAVEFRIVKVNIEKAFIDADNLTIIK